MGSPQKINEPAGPYLVSVWTDPDPLRVDEVHVTVAVIDPQTQAPILDSRVTVQLASLEEESVSFSAPATQENSRLKFLYVAVFEPPFAGPWRGTVIVDGRMDPVRRLVLMLRCCRGRRSTGGWLAL